MRVLSKFWYELCIFAFALTCAILLATSSAYSNSVINGINLWIACVIPALFPYFIITAILSSLSITSKFSNLLSPLTKRAFRTNGLIGYAFIMSVISGHPIGAKIVADLKNANLISQTESQRASAFCSASSPTFLISSVGAIMFNSVKLGLLLFICNLLSNVILGVIFSFYKRKDPPTTSTRSSNLFTTDNILYESIYGAVTSVLFVGGLITAFYVLTDILDSLYILSPLYSIFGFLLGDNTLGRGVIIGLLETTNGLKVMSSAPISRITLPLIASITGFSGLSVIAQSLAFFNSAKIKATPFILGKITNVAINFILGFILSLIFL